MSNNNENQFLNNNTNNESVPETENSNESVKKSDDSSSEIFNSSLTEYLRLTEEIKTLQKAVKIRRDRKENLSNIILTFLNQNNIKGIQLEGDYMGKQISEKKSVTTVGFSKSTLDKVLVDYFGNNIEGYNKVNSLIANKLTKKENVKLSLHNVRKQKVDLKKIKEEQAKQIESLLDS